VRWQERVEQQTGERGQSYADERTAVAQPPGASAPLFGKRRLAPGVPTRAVGFHHEQFTPSVSEAIKAGILAMIKAAAGKMSER